MKRPSFQFYPGDWLNDAALRSCSVGARGLWIEMICLMHQGSTYGYLKVNHKVILPPNLARMVGATLPEIEGWLQELSDAGVFSIDDDGAIFSRRMIRDEEIRQARAAGGIKGGNPALKTQDGGSDKVGNKVNLPPNLPPTPSSSSSSSSSSKGQENTPLAPQGGDSLFDDQQKSRRSSGEKPKAPSGVSKAQMREAFPDLTDQTIDDWITARRGKGAKTLTVTAWNSAVAEIIKSGLSGEQAVQIAAARSWQGIKSEWLLNHVASGSSPPRGTIEPAQSHNAIEIQKWLESKKHERQ